MRKAISPEELIGKLDELRPDGSALLRAAQTGDATAQIWVGQTIESRCGGRGLAAAYGWYRKAAEAGNEWAQVRVGRALLHGEGTEKDAAKASSYFRSAAASGSAVGHYWLGRCYELGYGVDWNPTLAVEHFETAAESGIAEAALRAAFCRAVGLGIGVDWRRAWRFLRMAVSQRRILARLLLTVFVFTSLVVGIVYALLQAV